MLAPIVMAGVDSIVPEGIEMAETASLVDPMDDTELHSMPPSSKEKLAPEVDLISELIGATKEQFN